jgi:hypothetical protein
LGLHKKLSIDNDKRQLIPDVWESGYERFCLRDDDENWKWEFKHRLVALGFYGLPPYGKPNALHKDDIKSNNFYKNIYWGSHKENQADRIKNGNMAYAEKHFASKLTYKEACKIRKRYNRNEITQQGLADEYGVALFTIWRIIKEITYTRAA